MFDWLKSLIENIDKIKTPIQLTALSIGAIAIAVYWVIRNLRAQGQLGREKFTLYFSVILGFFIISLTCIILTLVPIHDGKYPTSELKTIYIFRCNQPYPKCNVILRGIDAQPFVSNEHGGISVPSSLWENKSVIGFYISDKDGMFLKKGNISKDSGEIYIECKDKKTPDVIKTPPKFHLNINNGSLLKKINSATNFIYSTNSAVNRIIITFDVSKIVPFSGGKLFTLNPSPLVIIKDNETCIQLNEYKITSTFIGPRESVINDAQEKVKSIVNRNENEISNKIVECIRQ